MHIDELTSSLIPHESIMNKYDDTTLENYFKYQLHVTRGRGRGRSSSIGRGGRHTNHSDNINDSKYKEKFHNPK